MFGVAEFSYLISQRFGGMAEAARLYRSQFRMCIPPTLLFLVATARYKVSQDKRNVEGLVHMCAGKEETDRGHLCKGSFMTLFP